MAMHRRVTLPNIGGAVPFVHGRAHNSLDQDRQDFERNQVGLFLTFFDFVRLAFNSFFDFVKRTLVIV
jgi:hypothetical protein